MEEARQHSTLSHRPTPAAPRRPGWRQYPSRERPRQTARSLRTLLSLDTLAHVRDAGVSVCCGGIVGMGETRADRVGFVHALATLPRHPESVTVNALVPIRGTSLGDMMAGESLAVDQVILELE